MAPWNSSAPGAMGTIGWGPAGKDDRRKNGDRPHRLSDQNQKGREQCREGSRKCAYCGEPSVDDYRAQPAFLAASVAADNPFTRRPSRIRAEAHLDRGRDAASLVQCGIPSVRPIDPSGRGNANPAWLELLEAPNSSRSAPNGL